MSERPATGDSDGGGGFRWRVSWSYWLLAAGSFCLAGVSMLVDWMGPRLVFAFTTVCSVALVFGAVQCKHEQDPDAGGT